MAFLLSLIVTVSFFALIAGLIKPCFIKLENRKQVAIIFIPVLVISTAIYDFFDESPERMAEEENIEAAAENNNEIEESTNVNDLNENSEDQEAANGENENDTDEKDNSNNAINSQEEENNNLNENDTGINNNSSNEANNNEEKEAVSDPQNCSDFTDGNHVYEVWVENEYHSENDPLNLDGDSSGVPCLALTQGMEEQFSAHKQELNPTSSTPEYEYVEEDDVSIGEVIRLNYRIFPEKAGDITEEEMILMTEDFIEQLKNERDFNGVSIYFSSDTNEDSGYSIGMAQYYPNGTIGDAMDYQAGDYSDHEYNFNFGGIN